jgi:2-polyprenyl-3-methyl-5-hydroxy-6-metoxy-1,4-benzoquinol methylase
MGGGNGRLAVPLADMGHKLTVIDISEEALQLLKEESNSNIECVHSDIMAFQCIRNFDVVIAIDCIKYVTDASLEEIFAKVYQLVANYGVFIFSDMNTYSWRNHVRTLLGRNMEQYNIETYYGYALALQKAGFKVEKVSGYCWMPVSCNSNSSLVSLFRIIENTCALNNWISQSPWLLFAAKKITARL